MKTKKSAVKKWKNSKKEKIDCSVPHMFREESLSASDIKKLKKISDLKNLGPMAEKHFEKAGIKSPKDFINLGWKKSWEKLARSNINHSHTVYGYSLLGALKNIDWLAISAEEKEEAKRFAKELRSKFKSKQSKKRNAI